MGNPAVSRTPRLSIPDLKVHLEACYNITISQITRLDEQVFKIECEHGPSWVARISDASCPLKIVEGDFSILQFLGKRNFPAEQCAHHEPVSTTLSGHHLLVTNFVEGRRPRKGEQLFPKLGDLLGCLHTLDTEKNEVLGRRGGAWHHICHEGCPKDEIQGVLAMLAEAKDNVPAEQMEFYETLKLTLEGMEDFEDFPRAFVHPEFVPPNAIVSNEGELVIVDWQGTGSGPRVASFGFLLWAAGHRSMAAVEAVARGYRKHVSLTEGELRSLAGAIWFRPLVLRSWESCTGRTKLVSVVEGVAQMEELAGRIASVACKVLQDGANLGDN